MDKTTDDPESILDQPVTEMEIIVKSEEEDDKDN